MTNRSVRSRTWLAYVSASMMLASICWAQVVSATGTCSAPAQPSYTVSLPAGNIAVPANLPVGSKIAGFTAMQVLSQNIWLCSMDILAIQVLFRMTLPDTGVTFTDTDGVKSPVFATNVDGVGVAMNQLAYAYLSWYQTRSGKGTPVGSSWTFGGGCCSDVKTNIGFGAKVALALIKTGPIKGGTLQLSGVIGQVVVQEIGGATFQATNIRASGSATITSPSCTVPDINVALDRANGDAMPNIGDRAGASDFDVLLVGCPPGMNRIEYKLDAAPGTPTINAPQGILGVSADAIAKGYGVQITNRSDQAIALGAWRSVPGYTPGGGNLVIPLRAAYRRTSGVVGAGSVKSTAIITLAYF